MKINSKKIYNIAVAVGSMAQGLCLAILVDQSLRKVDCPKIIKSIGRNAATGMITTIYAGIAWVALNDATKEPKESLEDGFNIEDDEENPWE